MTRSMSKISFYNFIEKHEDKLAAYVEEHGFCRRAKVGLKNAIGQVLFMAFERNENGYEITSQNYFAQFGNERDAIARSSFTEARAKIKWQALDFLLRMSSFKPKSADLWNGLRLKAVDGTYLTLPNEEALSEKFPRRGKELYPKCLLVTAADVLTGQPLEAITSKFNGSERDLFLNLTSMEPKKDLALLDRGFSGIKVFCTLIQRGVLFLARVRADQKCSLGIKDFLKSGKTDLVVTLEKKIDGETLKARVRLVRDGVSRDGHPIVLATNLMSRRRYKYKAINDVYKMRWKVETMYLRFKKLFNVEAFHAKTLNGVMQEIYSNLVALAITAGLAYQAISSKTGETNLKSVGATLRRNFYLIVATAGKFAKANYKLMLECLGRARCIPTIGRKNPRKAKKPRTNWHHQGKNRAPRPRIRKSA